MPLSELISYRPPLLFLMRARHTPASGPLHLLFLLPGCFPRDDYLYMSHSHTIFRSLFKCLLAKYCLCTPLKAVIILIPASLTHLINFSPMLLTFFYFPSIPVCLCVLPQKHKIHEGKNFCFVWHYIFNA